MGRSQQFDTDEAVRAARALFWERGFEAASLPELQEATGLSRSSIYHAFGSKRGLFDAAVENYLDEVIRPRLRPMAGDEPDPEAVRDYFEGLRAAVQEAHADRAGNGCLLVNAACAPVSHDPALREKVAEYRAELHAAIASGVDARLPGRSAAERARTAEVATALNIAALVMTRIDVDEALRMVDAAIAMLD
ncbi:TetR/AcrR family transcriptional regulator [Salininema proteolyticum]|uniref:TetR/AcrR family transcriptional regulator n=1 Tax=Salininema proteolyticum TaxID=1607685 RepID=A0ABV8TZV6_9ACTN